MALRKIFTAESSVLEAIAHTSCMLLGWSRNQASDSYLAVDMHCHLGFYTEPDAMARAGQSQNVGFFSGTVTPKEYKEVTPVLNQYDNVRVGLGFHPWWVQSAEQHNRGVSVWQNTNQDLLNLFEDQVFSTRFVNEVGLDFSERHKHTAAEQLQVFRTIVQLCNADDKVISLHSVQATDVVLDVLEQHQTFKRSAVIFHWFSGTSSELHRAVKAGCYFSVGERFLSTKRAKEYLKVIPQNRLLLETDYPKHAGQVPNAALFDSLQRASELILNHYGC